MDSTESRSSRTPRTARRRGRPGYPDRRHGAGPCHRPNKKAADNLDVGSLRELTLKADNLVILIYLLNEEYFIACALKPEASFGKHAT